IKHRDDDARSSRKRRKDSGRAYLPIPPHHHPTTLQTLPHHRQLHHSRHRRQRHRRPDRRDPLATPRRRPRPQLRRAPLPAAGPANDRRPRSDGLVPRLPRPQMRRRKVHHRRTPLRAQLPRRRRLHPRQLLQQRPRRRRPPPRRRQTNRTLEPRRALTFLLSTVYPLLSEVLCSTPSSLSSKTNPAYSPASPRSSAVSTSTSSR